MDFEARLGYMRPCLQTQNKAKENKTSFWGNSN